MTFRTLMIATLFVMGLAACGKEGPPQPPKDEPITYPKTYPTR